MSLKIFQNNRIKFDRHEFAGSFGDMGTDFPLLIGIILASGIDVTSALVMFGLMQVLTGMIYGLPMPVQPLKAMAVLVITQKISGNILFGAGLAIGIIMLFLTATHLITWVARVVPKSVVRGIQFGLGLQLSTLALKDYLPSEGMSGYVLGASAFLLIIFLIGNKKYPAAPLVILLGIVYAFWAKIHTFPSVFGFQLPQFHAPHMADIMTGLVLLALPQLPLSICNSILATEQTAKDFFPEKSMTVQKIGFTYSFMNLLNPFFGGIPVCHGSGGLAGHHFFGARTGGSVILYGSYYLILGLFFSQGFNTIIQFFPKPILGIILVFEGMAMMRLIKDVDPKQLTITFVVGLSAVCLPYGYLVGLLVGTFLSYLGPKNHA